MPDHLALTDAQPMEAKAGTGSSTTTPRRTGRARAALVIGLLVGVLLTVFAVVNLDQVKVDWIVGTWSTPLIVVIVVSLLLGVAFDRCAQAIANHRSHRARASSRRS